MSLRAFLIYATIGALLGIGLVITRTAPIFYSSQPANTAAYRNTERTQFIGQMASGLKQYHKEQGAFPVTIPTAPTQICTSAGTDCQSKGLVDLSFLTTAGNYILGIPHDPLGGRGLWGSGFYIQTLSKNNLRITAPEAEIGKSIQITFSL